MINFEYARLVEEDRRREISARIRLERSRYPDDAASDLTPRHTINRSRGIPPTQRAAGSAR